MCIQTGQGNSFTAEPDQRFGFGCKDQGHIPAITARGQKPVPGLVLQA